MAALVRGIAVELALRGININNIQLGPFDTDMNAGSNEAIGAMCPVGRVGFPREAADLVSYLAASPGYFTGASLAIDGGIEL